MGTRKPTLAHLIIYRHLWAAALTLIIAMLGVLALADIMTLQARRHALARQLRAIETVDFNTNPTVGIYTRDSNDQVSFVLLDARGRWAAGHSPRRKTSRNAVAPPGLRLPWSEAHRVLHTGELEGKGRLPWVNTPVVWAARVMYDSDGTPMILVAWHNISAIRASATRSTYGIVVVTIVLAFVIGILLTQRTTRYVTRVLDTIADSSARLAGGDYQVRLPAQPTEELDRVSQHITRLAEDLEHATADLQGKRSQLERLEGLQRQFVADASHELRAPLTAMQVMLEAWQDGVLRAEEHADAVVRLLKETERLGTLVSNLLDLSRLESGREALALAPVDIADVASELRDTLADSTAAPILLEIPYDLPPALADRHAVYRVLQNLVANARRFTSPDGTIRIWAVPDGDGLRLGVTDTGSGISPEFLPRIWERFARDATARAVDRAGSGLGLAIVKALVETMGGEVGVESEPGAGTTVWMRLQTAPVAEPSIAA